VKPAVRWTEGRGTAPLQWTARWAVLLLAVLLPALGQAALDLGFLEQQVDSPEVELVWPIQADPGTGQNNGVVDLEDPQNIESDVIYDPVTGQYILNRSVGGSFDYRPPMSMSLDEYLEYDMERAIDRKSVV